MQLYIIRHAQSENNAIWTRTGGSVGRSADPLLSATGHKQAEALAKYLAQKSDRWGEPSRDYHNQLGFSFTHLYCSLMERAVITGTYIAQALKMPLSAWPEIHERGGIYEKPPETGIEIGLPGPNREYFEIKYPNLVLPEELDEKGWWNRPYESLDDAAKRARRFWAQLQDRHAEEEHRIAIVTHAGFINALFAEIFGYPGPNEFGARPKGKWFGASNASISRVNIGPDYALLTYLNRIRYLSIDIIT